MYKDVHFSATSFLSKTRRTLPRMGILPTFTPLKKPKFLLGGENTPFRAVFFLPLKPPTCSYCSDTRSEKLYVTDVLSIAQNSRCELHTEVQFTYRHGCGKAAGLASLQSKLELKNCTGTYSFSNNYQLSVSALLISKTPQTAF